MLHFYKYQIPFTKSFRTAVNEVTHREGIILVYREKNIEAYGEVAPLPGFSSESLKEVEVVLKMNQEHLQKSIQNGEGEETLRMLDLIHQFPSLSFGIDTLLHDLAAKRENKSLVHYLFPDFKGTVSCNGLLPIQSKAQALSSARKLIGKGFQTLKVKVGENFSHEKEILQDLRKHYPKLKIRIDANQAWTEQEAIHNLSILEPLHIEFCEQPVANDALYSFKKVKDSVQIPIAADESLRNKSAATELSENKSADIFVFKPMLMGTFNNIFVTKQIADTHTIETVFTTTLETAVGRAATAALSAGLGSPNRAQGLATGAFLKEDVAYDIWLNDAVIDFPSSEGLGISLYSKGLQEL